MAAVMRVPADKLPAYVGVEVDGGAYAVVQVVSATDPAQPDAQRKTAVEGEMRQQVSAADDYVYLQALKRKYDARVLKPELVRAAATPVDAKDAAPRGN
jgi:peptidyl-prolyl cis-trans isomerase D